MMDERTSVSQPSSESRHSGNGSYGWLAFWLIFFMLIGFGGVGFYLDTRLASLEEKVMTQANDVSARTESTLSALQDTRKDILGNRQETAVFAQKFSRTLDDMSTLLTDTVNAFSEQTVQLTKAIEKKEKSQSESLEVAIADLTKEIVSTRDAAIQAKSKAEVVDQQLALLSGRLEKIDRDIAAGFTTLTQYSQEMSKVVSAHLEKQKESLNGQLAELRDASNRSMDTIKEQLISLDRTVEKQQDEMGRFAQHVTSKADATHDSLARHIDAVADNVQFGFSEQKNVSASIQNRLEKTEGLSGSAAQIAEQLDTLTGNVELGFADGQENQEAIRSDLSELGYNLNGRTDNLLVELTALSMAGENRPSKDQVAEIESQLSTLAKNMQHLQSGLGTQLADAASAAVSSNMQSFGRESEEKFSLAVSHLKTLGAEVRILYDSVQSGIETTRSKAAEWMKNPQSEDAKKSFESGLLEFTSMIQSTRTQMDEIQKQISGLASNLTYQPLEVEAVSKPIGMAETPGEGTQ